MAKALRRLLALHAIAFIHVLILTYSNGQRCNMLVIGHGLNLKNAIAQQTCMRLLGMDLVGRKFPYPVC